MKYSMKAIVNSVTFEIFVSEKQYFVLYHYETKSWHVRYGEAIVYSYSELGNKTFAGPTSNRAGDILTEFFNVENLKNE